MDCLIANNVSGLNGAGFMVHTSCDATFINCLFIGNTAAQWGGGIRIGATSNAVITNCTFYANHADVAGGAFGAGSGKEGPINEITMSNCILWGNTSPLGPEIALNGVHPAELTISYSDVVGGKEGVYVEPGFTLNWGDGMIDEDPLFVDEASGDLHLTYTSPCKDTGDHAAVTESADFEGDMRIAFGQVDMGADEFYTHLYYTGDATPGGQVNVKFVGSPGDPFALCIGMGVLDTPFHTNWGEWWNEWWLQFPLLGPFDLGFIPSPDGLYTLEGTLPPDIPGPYSIPMQAIIGESLTNLCLIEVK
jgi:hypothetical protein